MAASPYLDEPYSRGTKVQRSHRSLLSNLSSDREENTLDWSFTDNRLLSWTKVDSSCLRSSWCCVCNAAITINSPLKITKVLTTRTTTIVPLAAFVETKDYQWPQGPHLSSMGPYLSEATTEATKSALDSLGWPEVSNCYRLCRCVDWCRTREPVSVWGHHNPS